MKYRSLFFAAFLVVAACAREEQADDFGLKTFNCFTVSVEETEMTKTHMEEGGAVKWDVDDCIGIFSDTQAPVPYYRGEDGKFRGEEVTGTKFYAFYPYDESVFDPEHPMVLHFPPRYSSSNPAYGLGLPMIAVSDNNDLEFKQTAGIVHFTVKGSNPITAVSMIGHREEKYLGEGTVDLSEDTPIFRLTAESAFSSIEYSIPESAVPGEPLDFYFRLPVMTFEKGLSLYVFYKDSDTGAEKSFEKKTSKAVTVSRGVMKSFSLVDIDAEEDAELEELEQERQILMAFYQAMGGDRWNNNSNWGSDKPISEWFGIEDFGTGHVHFIDLYGNNLKGKIPASFSGLKELWGLDLQMNDITGVEDGFQPMDSLKMVNLRGNINLVDFPYPLVAGKNVTSLDLAFTRCEVIPQEAYEPLQGLKEFAFGTYDKYFSQARTIPVDFIKTLSKVSSLKLYGFSGDIPEELYDLTQLEFLEISSQKMTGGISSKIGNLKDLKSLSIETLTDDFGSQNMPKNQLSGSIPESLYSCTELIELSFLCTSLSGTLSSGIGNLSKLQFLYICGNDLSGNLPQELTQIPFDGENPYKDYDVYINLSDNGFSGKVPACFKDWRPWSLYWYQMSLGNSLDISDAMPRIPDFEVSLLDGSKYSSSNVSNNELTVLFQWTTWCPNTPSFLPTLKGAYYTFKKKGLDVLGWSNESESEISGWISQNKISWPNFRAVDYVNSIWGAHAIALGSDGLWPIGIVPEVNVFDKNGDMVFSSLMAENQWEDFGPFIEEWFGESFEPINDLYSSSDYSADGTVHTLQTATKGNGINIVLMGDAFSDRLIADGTYGQVMQKAKDAFFSEEPYKTLKDRFNVYYVDVVSKNEVFYGETALETWYEGGNSTNVGGNDDKTFEYAKRVLTDSQMNDAVIIVMMNRDYYAGTCYMYKVLEGDYGRGVSVAYFPTNSDAQTFYGMVSHEAGGHGFGKLDDEYAYKDKGAIPAEKVAEYKSSWPYGWWKNTDFTSDVTKVKWAKFITDERYASENLGAYEGASTYWTGSWRPTQQSIMNQNVGGFNAPSREAIYYRAMKISEGADWEYDYETFVTFDQAARASAATSTRERARNFVERPLPPLHPPVVINHSWRDK